MKGDFYWAWSKDPELRKRAGSGGAVTSLLKFLLASKKVDAVFAVKPLFDNYYHGTPIVITKPEEVAELAGIFYCVSENLPKALKNYLDGAMNTKLAVVGRGCDLRGIIELGKRGKINLQNLVLLGLNCTGTLPAASAKEMFQKEFGVNPEDVVFPHIDDGKLTIRLRDGKELEKDLEALEKNGYGRRDNCRRCETPIPRMGDLAFGRWGGEEKQATFIEVCSESGDQILKAAIKESYLEVEKPSQEAIALRENKGKMAIEAGRKKQEQDFAFYRNMGLEQRFKYWREQFNQCIKCMGCRDACPICYCDECVLNPERGVIQSGAVPPGWTFSIIRVLHVADSCINCGQCQDVCPSKIPLSRLILMLNREIAEVFGYEPGLNPEEKPPWSSFSEKELRLEKIELSQTDLSK